MTPAQHAAIDAKVAELMGLDIKPWQPALLPAFTTDTAAAMMVFDSPFCRRREALLRHMPVGYLCSMLASDDEEDSYQERHTCPTIALAVCGCFLRAHGIDPDTIKEPAK